MDAAGGLPVFPNAANSANHLNNHLHLQQQQQLIHQQINQQHQQQHQQQQQEQLTPKRQAVVDRLRRRIETYRRRQTDCTPRFEQTFTGVCEQQSIETNQLQKRYLESKAKRQAKKTDKKQTDNSTLASNLQSSVHVVSTKKTFFCSRFMKGFSLVLSNIIDTGHMFKIFSIFPSTLERTYVHKYKTNEFRVEIYMNEG